MSLDSRLKGSRYMLHISRLLSQWWCGTEYKVSASELHFRTRSTSILPVEGHWEGHGDILWRPNMSPSFPFSVECKNQEKGQMDSILEAPRWPVWSWWEQCCEQAGAAGHHQLLLFTRNRRKDYAMVRTEVASRLEGLAPVAGPVLNLIRPGGEALTLCLFEDLMRVSPHTLVRDLKWTNGEVSL